MASNRGKKPHITLYEKDVEAVQRGLEELAAARRGGQPIPPRTIGLVPSGDSGQRRASRIDIRRDLADLWDITLGVGYRLMLLAVVTSPIWATLVLWKWLT